MTVRMIDGKARPGSLPGTTTRCESGPGPVHRISCPCGCGMVATASHQVISGSVEGGNLTLSPSLHMTAPGACGWHGFLVDGVYRSVDEPMPSHSPEVIR
ncbi:hypothetical protein DESA109040_05800 [Deinococcus saxicola]|uniref:DUF6527 family protein n=1 Tax=Deinococcus saxicola TaxID=249406 RepID=UPI0039F0DC6F